jgi:hypothetical protein
MLLPAVSISLIQRVVFPRPARVFEGSSGFWYFGWTLRIRQTLLFRRMRHVASKLAQPLLKLAFL